jgi:hypothetical protein
MDSLHYLCTVFLEYVDEHVKGKPRYKLNKSSLKINLYLLQIDFKINQEVHSSPPLTQILWGLVCSSVQTYVHFLTLNLIDPATNNTQHA